MVFAVSVAFWIVTLSPDRDTVPGAATWLPVIVRAFPALTVTLPFAAPMSDPVFVVVLRVLSFWVLATPRKSPPLPMLKPDFLTLTLWLSDALAWRVPMSMAPPAVMLVPLSLTTLLPRIRVSPDEMIATRSPDTVEATTASVLELWTVVVFLDERNPPFLTMDVASKVALSMTPVMVTLAPWTIVVPVPAEAFSPERTPAFKSAPAMVTLPVETPFASTLPTARVPPADTLDRRLVRLVSDVVLLVFLVRAAEDADAASSAEVMLTPPVPMRVALPPAAMSEPVMARVLPALTVRFPPLVSVVPLNVSVLLDEDVVVATYPS